MTVSAVVDDLDAGVAQADRVCQPVAKLAVEIGPRNKHREKQP